MRTVRQNSVTILENIVQDYKTMEIPEFNIGRRYIKNTAIRVGIITTITFFALFIICNTQPGKKFIAWSVRRSVMLVLNQQQFNSFNSGRCLIQNKFRELKFDIEQCELCENMNAIKRNIAISIDVMEFINWDIPIIVNASSDGSAMRLLEFVHLFLSNEALSLFQPCQFSSNLKTRVSEHRQLLNMFADDKATSFYALWENCAETSLKAFRKFYERPSVLGTNVQLAGSSWTLMCSDYESRSFRNIQTFTPLVVVFVQTGSVEIRLVPEELCADICSTLYTYLASGETLVFSGNLYRVSLRPTCNGGETLVIGVGGYYD